MSWRSLSFQVRPESRNSSAFIAAEMRMVGTRSANAIILARDLSDGSPATRARVSPYSAISRENKS